MTGPDIALYRLIRERAALGFAWGVRDCFLWSSDAVQATTGRDPAADLRGRYSSWPEARALLLELGGLRRLADDRFGTVIDRTDAGDGCIALLPRHVCSPESAEHGALGVVWRGTAVVQGDAGLLIVPTGLATRFWRPARG